MPRLGHHGDLPKRGQKQCESDRIDADALISENERYGDQDHKDRQHRKSAPAKPFSLGLGATGLVGGCNGRLSGDHDIAKPENQPRDDGIRRHGQSR